MESSAAMVRNGYPPKFMELKWVKTKPQIKTRNPKEINLKPSSISTIPIYISTDPSHINPRHLSELYKICNHSCHRFPKLDPTDGRIQETVDFDKLCVALSNSCVVVSVFSRISRSDDDESSSEEEEKISVPMLGNWMDRMNPVSPSNGQLVGFGRAVSDGGLTASIYDVMVIPSLRRMGIGRMIVKRIVRILTSRDIYDIAALCTEDERLFFRACGFGDDILASTTMMYTKTVDPCFKGDQMVKVAGRKLLLVPQSREENSLQL